MVWIDKYERTDGTPVKGHSRWAPGARREMAVLAVVAVAVLGIGGGGVQQDTSDGTAPRPQSTVQYPIPWDRTTTRDSKAEQPRPAVSYPVKFKTPKSRPIPTPTVSYPIDFATMGAGR